MSTELPAYCCALCMIEEPIDDALHDGELLCLICAEDCECTDEIRIGDTRQVVSVIVPTPRGGWKINVVETLAGR